MNPAKKKKINIFFSRKKKINIFFSRKKKIDIRQVQDKKNIAVFDLDGTVFRSSLMIELLEGLIEEEIFPIKVQEIYAREYQKWLDRKGPYDDYIEKISQAYRKFIKGIKDEQVWRVARKVIAFQKNRTYRFTRNLILKLKKTHWLLAISGSPRDMVKRFGREFGFDKTYSRIFEVDKKGFFTGRILFEELIEDKGKILKQVVGKENLTLKHSIGIGDTETDIPFLKLVEHPIAFNPNSELYQYARKRNWPIIVERKDVIYQLGGKKLPFIVKNALND
ncbi:MAG: HAD-IB family hydrolase [Candidatus Nealsonbacteria bacterium CG08_land_8_20_14_0_20_38_20]|uniref:HAD-IB family hydrolase n=1 Tax=Candidatus Nealsonbacteria bacterium CG08_land_8_20_14_0_20_38_20 TaxID=1974705 RepID=A0A2H0YM29_9BACT|nr:MAG: HAD-IB family hydrolase [Candidatus Nealsonbacteria bacterium CG08_land_8_20_14_0_20_38_20]